jgi:hypothetical protein
MTIRAIPVLSFAFISAFAIQGAALAVEKNPPTGVQQGVSPPAGVQQKVKPPTGVIPEGVQKRPTVKTLTVQECLGLGGETQVNGGCSGTSLICITNKGKPNEHKLCVTE